MKRLIALIALLLLVGAACTTSGDLEATVATDGDDESTSEGDADDADTGGTDTGGGGGGGDLCGIFESGGREILGDIDIDDPDIDLGQISSLLDEMVDSSPNEIRDDMALIAEFTTAIAEAFGDIDDLDPNDPGAFEDALEVFAQFEDQADEIEAAGANIEAWARDNCDLPDDFFTNDGEAVDDFDVDIDAGRQAYGDDPELDGLYDDCAAGDFGACDTLYLFSPFDSEYETFAESCGGVGGALGGVCEETFAGDGDLADGFGDDPELDALFVECEGGDLNACDLLYFDSPIGSEYEFFGATCGGRSEGEAGFCAGDGGVDTEAVFFGDDVAFDILWIGCADGIFDACDDLYRSSPFDSEYEAFALTCGDRRESDFTDCTNDLGGDTGLDDDAFTFGDDPGLDLLWVKCDFGVGEACDFLFFSSPIDSEYESFGLSCGGREDESFGLCT